MIPETNQQIQSEINKNQQKKLNRTLNERLGYSGVYFSRNGKSFFSKLADLEQRKLLEKLKSIYTQILFNCFSNETDVNALIEYFLELAFCVNLPMNKVVEIHIEVINELERQLKLESLDIDYLSDYRLVLIDVIAHLGEMYRSVVCENS